MFYKLLAIDGANNRAGCQPAAKHDRRDNLSVESILPTLMDY